MLIKNYKEIPSGFYVYLHKDYRGNVLYVGKGCGVRAIRKTDRSKEWVDYEKKNNIFVSIVQDELQEWAAHELEEQLVLAYSPVFNNRNAYRISKNYTRQSVKVNDVFTSLTGECKVLEYYDASNVRCRFLDKNSHEFVTSVTHLKSGEFSNPFYPTVHGVGYLGVGEYSFKKNREAYSLWSGMLCRVANVKQNLLCYRNVSVSEDWKCFQNFADWHEHNKIPRQYIPNLDKDILSCGVKIYSPETCCIVPKELNLLLVSSNNSKIRKHKLPCGVFPNKKRFLSKCRVLGKHVLLGTYDTPEEAHAVYLDFKQKHVKQIAEKYKTILKPKVYESLVNMNWFI